MQVRNEQKMRLQQLADITGGEAYFPTTNKALDQVFQRIVSQVRAQSSLGFISTDGKKDGTWRKLDVAPDRLAPAEPADPDAQGLLRGVYRMATRGGSPDRRTDLLGHRSTHIAAVVPLGIRATSKWPRRLHAIRPRSIQARHRFRTPRRPGACAGRARRGAGARRPPPGAARRHRVGQDVHDGAGRLAANRPTLVMAHNKTLAAQLYQEFRRFFPQNAVEYFVSYYDYYQPEAYVPASDTYIEKEATINDEIDRMRLSATRSLFERRDVIIVASVSCIYGLGSPEAYYGMLLPLARGQRIDRRADPAQARRDPVRAQRHRVRPRHLPRPRRHVEVCPSYEEHAVRIGLFGDEIDELAGFDPLTGKTFRRHDRLSIFPKSHYVTSRDRSKRPSRRSRPSWRVGAAAREGRQAPRGAAAAPADDVRPRDDPGDRLLPRHRELLAASDRAARRASRRRRCWTICRTTRSSSSTRATRPFRRCAACSRRPVAQGGAGRLRLPAAVRARQPAAELRGMGGARAARSSTSRRRRARTS